MDKIDIGKLEEALRTLPQLEQDVFRLSAIEHLDYVVIAGRLGLTVAHVEAKIADALVRLDELLEGDL